MTRSEISEEVWAVLEPLMPSPVGRSRPWTDHRLAVEGMAWKYRTGAPWRDVPKRFGKCNTIYKRFTRWAEDRTWAKLLTEVHKRADAAGKIDWVVSILDDRPRASARRDPEAGHRGLYRITRILAPSRLTTRSDAPGRLDLQGPPRRRR